MNIKAPFAMYMTNEVVDSPILAIHYKTYGELYEENI